MRRVKKTEGDRKHVERSFGNSSRSIRFEHEVDEENATAEMKNGVLTMTVPKALKEVRGAKRLSIKAS